MSDNPSVVRSAEDDLRLWRATVEEYDALMDRAERLQRQGEMEPAESLRRQAGNLLRSFPILSPSRFDVDRSSALGPEDTGQRPADITQQ